LSGVNDLAQWLESTPVSLVIAESDWLFPALESAHVIALALVVGSIAIVDLRLMGLALLNRPATELAARVLPVTWAGFGVAVMTGFLMFAAKPTSYLANPFFIGKFALLGAAGLNVLVFHNVLQHRLAGPAALAPPPLAIRASAAASLSLWVAIVAFGRWIGFAA